MCNPKNDGHGEANLPAKGRGTTRPGSSLFFAPNELLGDHKSPLAAAVVVVNFDAKVDNEDEL